MNGLRRGDLERASLDDLREMIDALDRPWAPEQNDRLRAYYHAARRDPHGQAKTDLAQAILRCMQELPPEDLGYVIERSAKKRSSPIAEWAVAFVAEVASEVLAQVLRAPRKHGRHRRHRHG